MRICKHFRCRMEQQCPWFGIFGRDLCAECEKLGCRGCVYMDKSICRVKRDST